MPNSSPLPPIQYDARDFAGIVEALQNYLKSGYPEYYNDFFASNEGEAIIELLAYIGDQLHFYLDKRVNNFYWDTVTRRDAAVRLSQQVAYLPVGPIGSLVDACSRYSISEDNPFEEYPGGDFATGDTITVKGGSWEGQTFVPGPAIQVDDLTFEVTDTVTIYKIDDPNAPEGSILEQILLQLPETSPASIPSVIRVPFSAGQSTFDSFTPTGVAFETFETANENIIHNSWQVAVNGKAPTDGTPGGTSVGDGWINAEGNSFLNHPPGSHVYTVTYIGKNKLRVNFGDGVTFGALPNGAVSVAYRMGGGVTTNISAGALVPDEHFIEAVLTKAGTGDASLITINLTNLEFKNEGTNVFYGGRALNGADEESLEAIKVKAPNHIRNISRAITEDDILSLAKEFIYNNQQVLDASVVRVEETFQYVRVSGDIATLVNNYQPGDKKIQYQGNDFPLYMPSFSSNLAKLYIWGGGTSGERVAASDELIHALMVYLNLGRLSNNTYINNVGMASLYYLVFTGGFTDISVSLDTVLSAASGIDPEISGVWYDPSFNAVEVSDAIRAAVVTAFEGLDPGESFSMLPIWKSVAAVPGVLKFGVFASSEPKRVFFVDGFGESILYLDGSISHGFVTGDLVKITQNTPSYYPPELVGVSFAYTIYYTPTQFFLATTYANAMSGTAIVFNGSGGEFADIQKYSPDDIQISKDKIARMVNSTTDVSFTLVAKVST